MATAHDEGGHYENQMVKCVIVGDTGVGKTRLICARACGTSYNLKQLMYSVHAPTVWAIDHYRKSREVYGRSWCTIENVYASLQLWDTFGYHDKDRKFAYSKADVILVCFSVVRPRSLKNVIRHWLPEIRHYSAGVPIVLCGTQIDLRYLYLDPEFIMLDKGPFYREITEEDIVTPDVGRATANEIGAMAYYETSVLVPYGIEHTFENVVRVALAYKREKHFWNMFNNSLKRVRKPQVQQPLLPPHPAVPKVDVPLDEWETDVKQLLHDDTYCDIVFRLQQGRTFSAHQIIVGTAVSEIHDLLTQKVNTSNGEHKPRETAKSNNGRSSTNPPQKHGVSDTKASFIRRGHGSSQETARLLDSEDSSASELSLAVDTPSMKSDKESSLVSLDHPVFCSIEVEQKDSISVPQLTIITLRESVCPTAFYHVLEFMYVWQLSEETLASPELITKIRDVAEMLDFQQLLRYLSNVTRKEDYLNMNLTSTSVKIHQHKLLEYGLVENYYADVVFNLEDGQVKAHKALLVARSDMMACMFSNNFMESSAKEVGFPGVTKHVFGILLEYLYTGSLKQLVTSDLLELMELANRLCLPRLQAAAEEMVVGHLQKLNDAGQEIFEEAVTLLEPAQLHNATQLADYCVWYLTCNYLQLHKRYNKLKQSLRPENQVLLSQRRWPPVWYLKEYDYYEKCQVDLERQKQSARTILGCHHGATESPSRGCLGFCSRRRRRVKYSKRVEEPM